MFLAHVDSCTSACTFVITYVKVLFYNTEIFHSVGPMGQIYSSANIRIKQADATGSRRSYYNKFIMFLTFCKLFNIDINEVSVNNAIAFIKVLAASGLTSSTILTYISTIKAKCL